MHQDGHCNQATPSAYFSFNDLEDDIKIMHLKRIRRYTGVVLAAVILLTSLLVGVQSRLAFAESPAVSAVYPQSGYYVQGTITVKYSVTGLQADQYEPFWSVDNGAWVRMDQPAAGQDPTTTIDVSKWNWRQDNTYKISMIALQKSNWQPVTTNVTIHIGSPLSQMLNAGTTTTAAIANIAGTTPLAAVATITNPSNALTGKTLYTDPNSSVAQQASAWASSHSADATIMNYLARQPLAAWFGGWNSDVSAATKAYVDAASAVNKVPVLVAYNIPQRDCGGYSAGGVNDAAAYAKWIGQFASGIGKRQALVILEPDALAGISCLSASDQSARLAMLSSAVMMLKQQTNATVYLDAGHPGWQTADYMADKLKAAGIANADGFSLNVSNYESTAANITYGNAISKAIGASTHFVIDTSRNGGGTPTNGQWCNPAGQSVGHAPTLSAASETGNKLLDAYLWVNVAGGSDGACGAGEEGTSAPAAGVWWPQMAREMLLNSGIEN